MGSCGSSEDQKTLEIEQELERARIAESKRLKLLLLGDGESGKSTLFKQFEVLYGKGFSVGQRLFARSLIYSNAILSSKKLILRVRATSGEFLPENMDSVSYIEDIDVDTTPISTENVIHFKKVWSDPAIQDQYEKRSEFFLLDNTKHFLDRLDEISNAQYLPDNLAIFLSRRTTTGIIQKEFAIDKKLILLCDVGGQRSERRKWINCFEGVHGVLFVTSLCGYSQVCFEDESQNRMKESLSVFWEVCNYSWFKESSIILLLNKKDIFTELLARIPISVVFPEYSGDGSYEDSVAYIVSEFKKGFDASSIQKGKELYVHVTCAIETVTIKHALNSIRQIIITHNINMIREMTGKKGNDKLN